MRVKILGFRLFSSSLNTFTSVYFIFLKVFFAESRRNSMILEQALGSRLVSAIVDSYLIL